MDTQQFLEHLNADTVAMAAAARSAPLSSDVPTCPDWNIRELVVHTGIVHRHKVTTLLGDHTDGPAPLPAVPGEHESDAAVLDWFDEGAALLLDACSAADLSEPTWTWCQHEHTKDWWVRRMAHETAIHRIDAELAAGSVATIDSQLAEDGIDEILDEVMTGGPPWGTVVPGDRTAKLVAGEREWALRVAVFSGTSPHSGETFDAIDTLVYDSASEPMATVTVDAATLDLWLWGRGVLPSGAISGDRSIVDYVRQVAAEGTG